MFLKSLSMKGFKSFADPTVLELEPGITVVVGPNGSGKSNVVDAVTWVLGAQGPRSLRSQKMEDVIFAGTTSRAPLGRAEVSLTIDNGSRRLSVDMAEVTITRTLFRSGDSEYAINGSPCRLLDIQDLLSDSGVGRQQHMIIGQGQLDTVLNARPEDRRAIIEEAAGVLKHRRRRERAERRLASTQENLERLGDLVREVRRQIRPLERQATAARSHAALSEELRAVRIHLAAAELKELEKRRATAATSLAALGNEEQMLRSSLQTLDEAASAAAAELSSNREVDLAMAVGRVQGLVERTRGTVDLLRERSRRLADALDAAADVDVVSTLEAEGARLGAELAEADEELTSLGPRQEELRAALEALAADERAHEQRSGAQPSTKAADEALARAVVRAEALRREVGQDRRSLAALDERIEVLEGRLTAAAAKSDQLEAQADALHEEAGRLAEAAAAAASASIEIADGAARAEEEAGIAEQQRHRTAARAEALARALSELEGSGGREALAGVDGVVGSLVDLVEIDAGWEAAFEAAAGASAAAVVVAGRGAAKEALSRLHRTGSTGSLLTTGTGPTGLGRDLTGLPDGAEAVRSHVRVARGDRERVGAALDALLGRAVRVSGWEKAVDLALDRTDLVVVTGHGDRLAASGWRVRSAKGVVTASAVEEAQRRATEAAGVADAAAQRLAVARAAAEEARGAATAAGRALDRHEAERVAIGVERSRVGEERERVAADLDTARRSRVEIADRVRAADGALAEIEQELPKLEHAAALAARSAEETASFAAEVAARRVGIADEAQRLEVTLAGLTERRRVLTERLAEVERRLAGHAEERQAAAERRRRLQAEGVALERFEHLVLAERRRLEGVLGALQRDYRLQVEAVRAGGERLEVIRRDRSSAELRVGVVRDQVRSLDLEITEVGLRSETLAETVRRELGSDPAMLSEVSELPMPDLPEGTTAAQHAASLAGRLASLGPVNPLALEELSVLEERHRELEAQVSDVRTARRDLQEVVRTLDHEIMQSFAAAAADVNEHFSSLVAMLFPGGIGRLILTEPDDLLHTGVEIEVRPAGRNIRRVSLLSGGERSLAALAFLFAVFRSRPSPFYLMDEVEAALDDVNLHRFLGLVREFRNEAQLIVVSHQKRTMETADALYGVTMAPGGSSQVVSQKVAKEPEAASS